MYAEQAIYTSMDRRGSAGYQLMSRSPGVRDAEASAIATWSPSHGGLWSDPVNHASVNFYPLPGGRFVLSRTCEGRGEYSGRGGRQLYTHALVIGEEDLRRSGDRPFVLYRDALALGHLHYRPDPPAVLRPARLSALYPGARGAAAADGRLARSLGPSAAESALSGLAAGRPVVLPYAGDRAALAEALVDRLPAELVRRTSFATSLRPSAVRPFALSLVGAT